MDGDLVKKVIRNSNIANELRDPDVSAIADIVEIREYKTGEIILQPGDDALRDCLLILAEGEAEARSKTGGILGNLGPGDLAGVISFVGGDVSQISAVVAAKTNCKILLLNRSKLESLLRTKPALTYYLMRGLVRSIHGIARRMEKQSEELKNNLYSQMNLY